MIRRQLPALLLVIAAITLLGCATDHEIVVGDPTGCTSLDTRLSLNSANMPVPPDVGDNKNCDWDVFAWNSFAALNWPVNPDQRGLAKPSPSFLGNTDHGAEVVWESFKEKGEVFQKNPTKNWNDEEISFEKVDLWDNFGGYCSAEDQQQGPKAASGPFALDKFHNRLDETAEVQSEARESSAVLCKGHPDPDSTDCYIAGKVVGPRVWKGIPALADGNPNPDAKPVYYEVKVNYDFFDYVMNPPNPAIEGGALYQDEVAAFNAMQGRIQLPFRTAAATGGQSTTRSVHSYQQGPEHTCDNTQGKGGYPCRVGAVHMKSAWITMDGEDASQYHTTKAIYYKTVDTPGGPVAKCAAVDTFGLIGLHAIQRVHSTNTAKEQQNTGGAFVFATWEHRSVIPETGSSDYTYVNYRVQTGDDQILQPYPKLQYAIPVTRMIPFAPGQETTCGLSQQQTCDVNEAARKNLGNSVWANYHLIGTQFEPVNCQNAESLDPQSVAKPVAPGSLPPDPTVCRQISTDQYAQPYFLANAVIETNLGLQQFSGQAKAQQRFTPPQWCQSTDFKDKSLHNHCLNDGTRKVAPAEPGAGFERNFANVTFGGNPINMGGCQGCHGVAQQNGYSFSFVLLDGQGGAGADTEEDAVIPATNLDQTIEFYIESATTSGQYLSSNPADRTKVTSVDLAKADTWRLVPYYRDRNTATFPGVLFVYNATQKKWLTTGKASSSVMTGTQTMTLADLIDGGGTSAGSQQQFFNVVGFSTATVKTGLRAVAFNALSVSGLISAPAGANATATAMDSKEQQQDDQGFFLTPAKSK